VNRRIEVQKNIRFKVGLRHSVPKELGAKDSGICTVGLLGCSCTLAPSQIRKEAVQKHTSLEMKLSMRGSSFRF
jgi:hypothetical protein